VLYFDSDHHNHEVSLLDADSFKRLSVDSILALENKLLSIHFERLQLLDLVLNVEDLHKLLAYGFSGFSFQWEQFTLQCLDRNFHSPSKIF
jgi:hypothetical protein